LVIPIDNRVVEVEIRTELQHHCAELSEKFADKAGHAVQYGGGADPVRTRLDNLAWQVKLVEQFDATPSSIRNLIESKAHRNSLMSELLVDLGEER
jgi:ppGpp synthetase/RelA/SpoT-type nucleotidyltranferase